MLTTSSDSCQHLVQHRTLQEQVQTASTVEISMSSQGKNGAYNKEDSVKWGKTEEVYFKAFSLSRGVDGNTITTESLVDLNTQVFKMFTFINPFLQIPSAVIMYREINHYVFLMRQLKKTQTNK